MEQEGVDERDGTRMSSRTKRDSHFESYDTIFNTCYTLEEATMKRIKQSSEGRRSGETKGRYGT